MDKLWVADTNVLLDDPEIITQYDVVVLADVIRELEKHKKSFNKELAFNARRTTRYLDIHKDNVTFDLKDYKVSDERFENDYVDNRIIEAIKQSNGLYGLITNDILLKFKAKGLNIAVIEPDISNVDEYTGVFELYITSSEEDQQLLASIYENPRRIPFSLVKHQYLFIWDKEKPTFDEEGKQNGYEFIDSFRYDGEKLNKFKYKAINNKFLGKVKPINKKQEMLFDLLQNDDITIKTCLGKYGVGKDFIMISHALELIEQGKVDKLIWARNNVELADVPTLGILPGDKFEKLVEFAMPLADHVGGVDGLEMLIKQGKIEIQHLGSLRGRDIKRSIIYVTECQNNTKNHMELLIGRVGKESQLWLNGDLKQTDKDVFRQNSGIRSLSNLKGNRLFGQVTLDKTERSDTAQLAELLG